MTIHTFKVGDRVRIRQWDDMVKEFGITDDSIDCKYAFTTSMKHLCGRAATICKIYGDKILLEDWSDNSYATGWEFSTDMIEPVDAPKQSKWTPEPAKYHNGNNWFTKETVCIDGKEMTVEQFKAATTLYRSALSAYNKYFPQISLLDELKIAKESLESERKM